MEFTKVLRNQHGMNVAMAELRSELGGEIAGLRSGLGGEIAGLRSDVAQFRTELGKRFESIDRRFEGLEQRFDAISARLKETEQSNDRLAREIHALHVEVVGQYNEIINALQSGQGAQLDVNDLKERFDEFEARLAELERRIGRA